MPAQKGRIQGGAHQLPAGDEGHVCALPHGEGLVHLEAFRHGIVHVLHGVSSHPDVGWVVVLHQDFQQGLGEEPVAGQVHPQAGDGGQGRDVLGAVVGHAQGPVADAPGDADELYIGVGVGHVHLHLLHAAGGEEAGRGRGKGPQAAPGHARRRGDKALLGDAHLHKLLRELLGKGRRDAEPRESLHSTVMVLSFLARSSNTWHITCRLGMVLLIALPPPFPKAPYRLPRIPPGWELCGATRPDFP